MGFDFLMVSDPDGNPLAAVMRNGNPVLPLAAPHRGLLMLGDKVYQIASVPVDQGDDNLGALSVGEVFDFSGFSTPAVLIHDGRVIASSIPRISTADATQALAGCVGDAECEVHLGRSIVSLSSDGE